VIVERASSWPALKVHGAWDPHSTYFGALAEMGLGGLLAVFAVFVAGLWQIVRAYQAAPARHRALVWALLAAMLGYLLMGIDDDLLTKRWWWLGLAMGGSAYQCAVGARRRGAGAA
jgi:O-antigen ligase